MSDDEPLANRVLKKLRTALDYQSAEIARLIELGGLPRPSASRVTAWLRAPSDRRWQRMRSEELLALLDGVIAVERDGASLDDQEAQ